MKYSESIVIRLQCLTLFISYFCIILNFWTYDTAQNCTVKNVDNRLRCGTSRESRYGPFISQVRLKTSYDNFKLQFHECITWHSALQGFTLAGISAEGHFYQRLILLVGVSVGGGFYCKERHTTIIIFNKHCSFILLKHFDYHKCIRGMNACVLYQF